MRLHVTTLAPALRVPLAPKATWRLRDGRRIWIRAVTPDDADAIQAFVRELSDDTRRRRFFSPIRELHPDMLNRMIDVDHTSEEVLLAVARTAARETIIGIAQYAAHPDGAACEFAVVVADAWHGHGLGRRLTERLLDAARRAGIERAEGDLLPANRPMVGLARAMGFDLAHSPDDPTMLRISGQIPKPPRKHVPDRDALLAVAVG
jgi:acetyltransferase